MREGEREKKRYEEEEEEEEEEEVLLRTMTPALRPRTGFLQLRIWWRSSP